MKLKTILASILLTTALAAQAENWVMVSESDQNVRLLVDSDGFTSAKGDDGTPVIAAPFTFFSADGQRTPTFAYVTTVTSCRTRNGILLYRTLENNAWVTKQTYFWSVNGKKMYDVAGNALCDILDVRMKEAIPTAKKSKTDI